MESTQEIKEIIESLKEKITNETSEKIIKDLENQIFFWEKILGQRIDDDFEGV